MSENIINFPLEFLHRFNRAGKVQGGPNSPVILAVEFQPEDFEVARQNKNLAQLLVLYHSAFGYLRSLIKQGATPVFAVYDSNDVQEIVSGAVKQIATISDLHLVKTAYGEEIHANVARNDSGALTTYSLFPTVAAVSKNIHGGLDVTHIQGYGVSGVDEHSNMLSKFSAHDPLPGAFIYINYGEEGKEEQKADKWQKLVAFSVSDKDALDVIEERANGTVHYCYDTETGKIASIDIQGELCLDELEAAFVYLLRHSAEPVLVGDHIDRLQREGIPFTRIVPTHPLFEEIDSRHGITPSDALVFRTVNPNNELLIEGMASSKGGRVWIDRCTSLAALQAVIVELTYYCQRRDYGVTHVEKRVEQMRELEAEQNAEAAASVERAGEVATAELPKEAKLYVLYHADSDGRFAGYCAWEYFQARLRYPSENVQFIEVQYGQDFPIEIGTLRKHDAVYILDFSYKRSILESVAAMGCFLQVLDHHKSAKEELEGLPYAHFDMTKSGALLAWEYFFPNGDVPMACVLVNDRDLWLKQYKQSRAFEAYLRLSRVGSDWNHWQRLVYNTGGAFDRAIAEGEAAVKCEDALISKVFKSNRHKVGIDTGLNFMQELKYVIYNCPGVLHSEVAEKYYTELDVDFTIGWRLIEDNKMLFSLRSPKRYDVSDFARAYGGGGHAAAAGFTMPMEQGFALVAKYHK